MKRGIIWRCGSSHQLAALNLAEQDLGAVWSMWGSEFLGHNARAMCVSWAGHNSAVTARVWCIEGKRWGRKKSATTTGMKYYSLTTSFFFLFFHTTLFNINFCSDAITPKKDHSLSFFIILYSLGVFKNWITQQAFCSYTNECFRRTYTYRHNDACSPPTTRRWEIRVVVVHEK